MLVIDSYWSLNSIALKSYFYDDTLSRDSFSRIDIILLLSMISIGCRHYTLIEWGTELMLNLVDDWVSGELDGDKVSKVRELMEYCGWELVYE